LSLHTSDTLQYIKGIGPKRAAALREIGVDSVSKLLYYIPRDYLDRSRITTVKDLPKFVEAGNEVTVVGSVFRQEIKRTRRGKQMFFLTLKDASFLPESNGIKRRLKSAKCSLFPQCRNSIN
jgi:ATP-dependent DNA helicase RecG